MRREYIKCSLPTCDHGVAYRNVKNGRPLWKTFCERHRNKFKFIADRWKMNQGCANKDGRYGIPCTSLIASAGQLQVNHIDGNNHNRDSSNIEVLCGNCHQTATIQGGHHLNQEYRRTLDFAETGLFTGLGI